MSGIPSGYIIDLCLDEVEDGFYAYCPGLKGVNETGETEEEAINNAIESIKLIISVRLERGESLPESDYIKVLFDKQRMDPIPLVPNSLKFFLDARSESLEHADV